MNFRFRHFLVGSALLFSQTSVLLAEGWEQTIPPFAPEPFPAQRPVQVQYTFGWNGVTAATADVQVIKTAEDRFRLEAAGHTIGFARTLWKFDIEHVGISDARTLRPLRVQEVETGRSKRWNTELSYSPEGVVSQREQQAGSTVSSKKREFNFPNVLSLSSALLYLRTKPLTEGAVERVVVYPTTSAYLCTISVLGREHLSVAAGSYDAIKLDVQLGRIGKKRELLPHKKFKRATVWLSDDSDRLLLRAEAQIFIGSVFAELQAAHFANAKP